MTTVESSIASPDPSTVVASTHRPAGVPVRRFPGPATGSSLLTPPSMTGAPRPRATVRRIATITSTAPSPLQPIGEPDRRSDAGRARRRRRPRRPVRRRGGRHLAHRAQRRDDRPRGRARAGRHRLGPDADPHPAALRHLRGDGLEGAPRRSGHGRDGVRGLRHAAAAGARGGGAGGRRSGPDDARARDHGPARDARAHPQPLRRRVGGGDRRDRRGGDRLRDPDGAVRLRLLRDLVPHRRRAEDGARGAAQAGRAGAPRTPTPTSSSG